MKLELIRRTPMRKLIFLELVIKCFLGQSEPVRRCGHIAIARRQRLCDQHALIRIDLKRQRFRAGAGFGLVFRGSIDGGERVSGYSFDLDPVASGGGYLVRLWDDSRQHWRPLAHTPITDPGQLYGHHVVRVTLRSDQLTVQVDDEPVLEIAALSRASVDAGREPCRGDRVGIQAWSTTEVTVESFRVATL